MSKLSAKLNKAFKTTKLGPGKGVAFVAICLCVVLFVGVSIAWFTSQINLTGGEFSTGTIDFLAYGYDANGTLITTIYPEGKIPEGDSNANSPLFSDSDMQAGSVSTAYIAIKNNGTLDMEYKLSFSVSAHQGETSEDMVYLGGYWYSLMDITASVTNDDIAGYAAANKAIPCNADNCTGDVHTCNESVNAHNLSTISQYSGGGIIKVNSGVLHYYRLDYGVRRDATTTDYAGRKFAVNANVFTSQVGTIQDPDGGYGVTRYVSDVPTLEAAIDQALPGDTILLMNDVTYNGDLIIKKCINFEAGGKTLTVNGNMLYDFVSTLPLKINLQGKGTIKVLASGAVGGNFTISAPQSQVELVGGNTAGDLFVGRYFTVDATNALESGGCIFSDIVIMDGEGKTAKAVYVRSNTKITVSTGVTLERIEAAVQATNIEIRNAGQINQILLSSMFQTSQVDAPQIYIHNYNRITNITLPLWSAPFVKGEDGTFSGNTRIVVSAGGVIDSLTGSERFNASHIEDEGADLYVEQIVNGVDTGLRVYYRNLPNATNTTLQQLISDYFTNKGLSGVRFTDAIEAIDTLEVICRGDKELSTDDLKYMNNTLKSLSNLDLSQSVVAGNALPGQAFLGKTSLTTISLPKNLEIINTEALSTTGIKAITIPATVTSLKSNALRNIPYVYMQSYEPCSIVTSNISGYTYFFVPESALTSYRETGNWVGIAENIYPMAQLDDDGDTHVRKLGDGTYEIVHYLGTEASLVVGKEVSLNGTKLTITQVGEYAYRHIKHTFTLSFDQSVRDISAYAFYYTKVSGIVDFNNVSSIGAYAFSYCSALNEIPSNNCIKTIGSYAFSHCVRLHSVSLPAVEAVEEFAFADNSSMVSVSFGENLKKLARNQFQNATYLREVTIKAPASDELTISGFTGGMTDATKKVLRVYVLTEYYDDFYTNYTALSTYLCEDGDKYGTYNIEVYYNNGHVGDVNVGQFRARAVGNNTLSISSCNVFAADVSDDAFWSTFSYIPETIDGKTVVRIGPNAYRSMDFSNAELQQDNVSNPWGNCNAVMPAGVTEIGAYAFYKSNVTLTALPGVQTIGKSAFEGCTHLYVVNAPELVDMAEYAFYNIKSLYQFKAEKLETVNTNALSNCTNLLRIYIPSVTNVTTGWLDYSTNVTELWIATQATSISGIPNYQTNKKMLTLTYTTSTTQRWCDADVALPANVSDYVIKDADGNTLCVLEDMAEYWVSESTDGTAIIHNAISKSEITSTYIVPGVVDAVKNGATVQMQVSALAYASFMGIDFNGNDVQFHSNIKTLGNRVFYLCDSMRGTLDLNGITTIGQYCFASTPITRIIAPKLTTSGTRAFDSCVLLKSASLPRLTTLPTYHFNGCTALESLYLEDLSAISSNAFTSASKLTNITINRVVTTVPTFSGTYATSTYKFEFYVPSQCVSLYNANTAYNKFNIHALDTVYVTAEGSYSLVDSNGAWEIVSFIPSTDITTLTIPASYDGKDIASIKVGAFTSCANVTEIVLPATYRYHQPGVFDGLASLQTISVDSSSAYFKSVGGVLFSQDGTQLVCYPANNSATSYTVPAGTEVIQSFAFANANLLETVTIPADVKVIGYNAFSTATVSTVVFQSTTPPYVMGLDVFDVTVTGFTIRVPAGYADTYKTSIAFYRYQAYISE